jgi:hypothetical protein
MDIYNKTFFVEFHTMTYYEWVVLLHSCLIFQARVELTLEDHLAVQHFEAGLLNKSSFIARALGVKNL